MRRATGSAFGGAGTADEGTPATRRVAWSVIIAISCAFSYSIGWQKGWMDGDGESERRFKQLNETLLGNRAAAATPDPADVPPGNV